MDLNEKACRIIESASYITLATSKDDKPWLSPVTFWLDEFNNIYCVSHIDSKHVQYIKKNKHVSISIFDSNIPEGLGANNGLQCTATATLLKKNETDFAMLYFTSRISEVDIVQLRDKWYSYDRVIIKIVLDNIYINCFDGKRDYRQQVSIYRKLNPKKFRSKL